MKVIEQENKQMQAEIIDRIDALHAAVVRRRVGWIGSMAVVAVACGIWLWPADISQPTALQHPLVAHQVSSPLPTPPMAEKSAEKCTSPTIHKPIAPVSETPNEEVVEPTAEEPTMIPDMEIEKEIAQPLVVETHENLVAAVEEMPSEPQGVVRLYETPKRHRGLKGLFDAANNPNTDGTTLSIKFNIKTSKS